MTKPRGNVIANIISIVVSQITRARILNECVTVRGASRRRGRQSAECAFVGTERADVVVIWRAQNNTLVEGLHFVAACTSPIVACADVDTARSAFLKRISGRRIETFENLGAGNGFEAIWNGIGSW